MTSFGLATKKFDTFTFLLKFDSVVPNAIAPRIFTARRLAKRGICRRRVSVCPSHSGIVSKRLNV